MVAKDKLEAEFMVMSGLCPICEEEINITKHIERHDDNPYHNETVIIGECPLHGDVNDILSELEFEEEE